jgi:ferrous iron transport protein A
MTLLDAVEYQEYRIVNVNIENDDELVSFLFSLGCYSGESITVISKRKSGCIVAIKDARYNVDRKLANAIEIE